MAPFSIHNSGASNKPSALQDPMLAAAVRAELAEPAKKIAEDLLSAGSPIRWFEKSAKYPLAREAFIAELEQSRVEEPDSFIPLPADGTTSESFTHRGSIFDEFEVEIKSFQDLIRKFGQISNKFDGYSLSWRGQADYQWALNSSLYRKFVDAAGDRSDGVENFPSEAELVASERKVLVESRESWRMGNVPALELLVRMQHRGIPTRLLDVTRNPLLALWFAVTDKEKEGVDARIFAIATKKAEGDPVTSKVNAWLWNADNPFWFADSYQSKSTLSMWGAGARLQEVYPPDYDSRISAQNALFLLDGAPSITEEALGLFNRVSGGRWNVSDIAASMSIVLFPVEMSRRSFKELRSFSPVITLRIPSELKAEIADMLSRTYGYSWANIYPDIEGVKAYLDKNPDIYSK